MICFLEWAASILKQRQEEAQQEPEMEFNSRLKILFLTKNFESRMEKSSFYLAEELRKHVVLETWEKDGHIKEILDQVPINPDFILLNDYKYDYCPWVWGFSEIDIPVGAIMHDLKFKVSYRRNFYLKEQIKYIFPHYRDAALRLFPDIVDRFHWLPHHVPLDIYKDWGLDKDIDYLMIGAMFPKLYKERIKMYEVMKDEPGFLSYSHPGYKELESKKENNVIGEEYARVLNRAKMFITCDSSDHFPLMKYFEVLASNTLLLASASNELADLGFVDGETFVAVTSETVREKARYYLSNEKERLAIAKRGYEMVRERHSTERRAQELLEKIVEIVSNESGNT